MKLSEIVEAVAQRARVKFGPGGLQLDSATEIHVDDFLKLALPLARDAGFSVLTGLVPSGERTYALLFCERYNFEAVFLLGGEAAKASSELGLKIEKELHGV